MMRHIDIGIEREGGISKRERGIDHYLIVAKREGGGNRQKREKSGSLATIGLFEERRRGESARERERERDVGVF